MCKIHTESSSGFSFRQHFHIRHLNFPLYSYDYFPLPKRTDKSEKIILYYISQTLFFQHVVKEAIVSNE